MKITFWKSFGMGVADIELPPSISGPFKRQLGDNAHCLKYIIILLHKKGNQSRYSEMLDEILGITDAAKRYNLNQNEFQTACQIFAQRIRSRTVLISDTPNQTKTCKRRITNVVLPIPKVGTILYRKDSRRKGLCKVVEIDQLKGRIIWQHSGRKSTVSIGNLRNPALYSLEKIY